MAIKHVDVMVSGQRGLHTEWNKDHTIDGDVPFGANKATGVKDPTADQDAATKKYVDDVVGTIKIDSQESAPESNVTTFAWTTLKTFFVNPNVDAMILGCCMKCRLFTSSGVAAEARIIGTAPLIAGGIQLSFTTGELTVNWGNNWVHQGLTHWIRKTGTNHNMFLPAGDALTITIQGRIATEGHICRIDNVYLRVFYIEV